MRGRTAPTFIQFHDGARERYTVPANTLDPRYIACVDHRAACDCREAELAEDRAELNAELKHARSVIRRVLAGHPTGCMCTGCQIARELHLRHLIDNDMPGPMERQPF